MPTETRRVTAAARFLRKARESLASASADVRAKRYNSAANRAYYAAFQAAVAALIHCQVRSADSSFEHRFVSEEFSGKLIRRRKVFAGRLSGILNGLFAIRLIGDYRPGDVSARQAKSGVAEATLLVEAVGAKLEAAEAREPRAEYGTMTVTAKNPKLLVTEVEKWIGASFPATTITRDQRGDRDFTLEVSGIGDDEWEPFRKVYQMTDDILVDQDVWIVVLPLPLDEN